jgi:hypothetical protein
MINEDNHFVVTFVVNQELEMMPIYQDYLENRWGAELGRMIAAHKHFDIDEDKYGRQYGLDLYVFTKDELDKLIRDVKQTLMPMRAM